MLRHVAHLRAPSPPETLFAAVAACVSGPRLTLTDIGRRFESKTSLRHGIKRADRLLGNGKLQGERRMFYAYELGLPGLRSRPLEGFPYLVFYVERKDCIDVWRVLHGHRDITRWMRKEGESHDSVPDGEAG